MNKKIIWIAILVIIIASLGWYVYKKGVDVSADINSVDQVSAAAVAAPLSVSIVGPTDVVIGSKVSFTAKAVGGVNPLSYVWMFSNGASASGAYGAWTAAKPLGKMPVNVAVKDATGKVVVAQTMVNVKDFVGNVSVSNLSSSHGTVSADTRGVWRMAYPSFTFTVTNNTNLPIYISKVSSAALATTTSTGWFASSTVVSVVVSGSTVGDTNDSYMLQPESSRTFTYNYASDNTNGEATTRKKLSITRINYGLSPNVYKNNDRFVDYGLQNFYVWIP